jgi:hypothetical protein
LIYQFLSEELQDISRVISKSNHEENGHFEEGLPWIDSWLETKKLKTI